MEWYRGLVGFGHQCFFGQESEIINEGWLHEGCVTGLTEARVGLGNTYLFKVFFRSDKSSTIVLGDVDLSSRWFGEFVLHLFD